jgi:hypothetical protein
MKTIKGTVVYKNIGPGCWGIVDEKGGEWRPVDFPEQLKKEGRVVTVRIKEVNEAFSIFMWGKAVEVVGFYT